MYAPVAVSKKYESWLERKHPDVTNGTSSPLSGKWSYSLLINVFYRIFKPDEFETWSVNLVSDLSSLFQMTSHFMEKTKTRLSEEVEKDRSLI